MSLRIHVDAALAAGLEFDLPPGPARHVQVRRAQPGDALVLFDGRGGEWAAEVRHMGRQQVTVQVMAHSAVDREPALGVTLAVGMPANDRMDWLVEKATELGVAMVQPLMTDRSVLRLDGERAQRKRDHWQGIAVAASEQSGRTRVPVVAPVLALGPWLAGLGGGIGIGGDGGSGGDGHSARWLLSPGSGPLAPRAPVRPSAGAVLALSGPEGGLSPAEEALAQAHGFEAISLGPRVLRADTAPLALLAWLTLPQ